MNSPSDEPRQPIEVPQPSPSATSPNGVRTTPELVDTFDLWFAMDFRSIWRRRWRLLVIPTAFFVIVTLIYCFVAKPEYQAEGTIMLQWEQQGSSSLSSMVLGAAASDISSLLGVSPDTDDLTTQMQVLTSDQILSTVATKLKIEKTPTQLRKQVKVVQDELGGNVLDLTATGDSPLQAQEMANDIVAAYKQNISDEGATVLGSSAKLVRQQIRAANRDLKNAGDRLVAYGVKEGTIDPDTENSKRIDLLSTIEGDYLEAQQKAVAAYADRSYFRSVIKGMPEAIVPNVTFGRNQLVDEAKSELGTLEAERATLAAEYKPADPDMIANEKQIDDVKRQIIALREAQDSSINHSVTGPVGTRAPNGYVVTTLNRELNPEVQDVYEKLVQADADWEANAADEKAILPTIAAVKGQFLHLPSRARRIADLKDDYDTDQKIRDALILQMHDLDAQRGTEQIYATMLENPVLPKMPSSPDLLLYTAAALVGGVLIGLLAMLGAETRDKRIRGPHDIFAATGLPILESLPLAANANQSRGAGRSAAMRRLASSLGYLGLGRTFNTLLVTSALPGEGVSYAASRLALELAEQGKTVTLVDANLRSPGVNAQFGVENTAGLAALLRGGGDPLASLVPVAGRPLLSLLPAGQLDGETAAQALRAQPVAGILTALRARADAVIIDAPAILEGLETSSLANIVEACILVTAEQYAERDDVRRATALLLGCSATTVGVILNQSGPKGKPPI